MSPIAKFRLPADFAQRRIIPRGPRTARREGELAMTDSRTETERRRLKADWEREERSAGVRRPYAPEDVLRLRNSFPIRHSHAERGAERLRGLLETEEFVAALGALTGN